VVVSKQAEAKGPVQVLIRKYAISKQAFYRWRKQRGGLGASGLQQLRQLKEENCRLKAVRRRKIIEWTIGPTAAAFVWISSGQGNRSRTASSRVSTAISG